MFNYQRAKKKSFKIDQIHTFRAPTPQPSSDRNAFKLGEVRGASEAHRNPKMGLVPENAGSLPKKMMVNCYCFPHLQTDPSLEII